MYDKAITIVGLDIDQIISSYAGLKNPWKKVNEQIESSKYHQSVYDFKNTIHMLQEYLCMHVIHFFVL